MLPCDCLVARESLSPLASLVAGSEANPPSVWSTCQFCQYRSEGCTHSLFALLRPLAPLATRGALVEARAAKVVTLRLRGGRRRKSPHASLRKGKKLPDDLDFAGKAMSLPRSLQNEPLDGLLEDDQIFSLVLGGPLYQLYLRTKLTRRPLDLLLRRVVGVSLFCWLPLFSTLPLLAPHHGWGRRTLFV